jgi:hypothetical protein
VPSGIPCATSTLTATPHPAYWRVTVNADCSESIYEQRWTEGELFIFLALFALIVLYVGHRLYNFLDRQIR